MFISSFYRSFYIQKSRTRFLLSTTNYRHLSDGIKKVVVHNYNKKKYEQDAKLSEECKNYIDLKTKISNDVFLNKESKTIYRKNCNKNLIKEVLSPKEWKYEGSCRREEGRKGSNKNVEERKNKPEDGMKDDVEEKKKSSRNVNESSETMTVSYLLEYKKMKRAAEGKKKKNDILPNDSEKETVIYANGKEVTENGETTDHKTEGERATQGKCSVNSSCNSSSSVHILNTSEDFINDDLKYISIDNSDQFSYLTGEKEIIKKMKLHKGCSHLGFCSARYAFENLKSGIVSVNDVVVYENIDIDLDKDKVELTKRGKELLKNKITILVNKPPNYLSISTDDNRTRSKLLIRNLIKNQNQFVEEDHKCMSYFIYKHVNIEKVNNLYLCGRLDKKSSGLLIFAQNTLLSNHLLNKYKYKIEKEYIINTYHPITENNLQMLKQNLCIDGKYIYKCHIQYIDRYTLKFILYQGFHKIIRKMALVSNIKIKSLHRTRIGNVHINKLPMGKWRFLMPNETFI